MCNESVMKQYQLDLGSTSGEGCASNFVGAFTNKACLSLAVNKRSNEETRAQKKRRREENRKIQDNLYWVRCLYTVKHSMSAIRYDKGTGSTLLAFKPAIFAVTRHTLQKTKCQLASAGSAAVPD